MLKKKSFLCGTDYDEGYMDWHCRKGGKAPRDGQDTYLVCGTPFPNHIEYIVVVTAFALLGIYVYYQMLACSGRYPRTTGPPAKPAPAKGNQRGRTTRSKKAD